MLRARPEPVEHACLSFDVGSINCGVCLFDGRPSAQQILFCTKRPLLNEHAHVVHDVTAVKQALDEITRTVTTLLQGRPYWVLVEEEFAVFESDKNARKHCEVFNLQLESCIRMYFAQKQIEVRTTHATERFPFLGIHGWRQMTRWDRKQHVTAAVSKLLDKGNPGNRFAHREHDLTGWEAQRPSQRHDTADAISQALLWYYRNAQDVRECRPSPLASDNEQATSSQQPPRNNRAPSTAPPSASRRGKPSEAELQEKFEQTLTQLGIDYYDLVRGEREPAAKLYKVWRHSPNNQHLLEFLQLLDAYNSRGSNITDQASLEPRVTPLLT